MTGSAKFRCEADAYEFLETWAWRGCPRCPHCDETSRLGRLRGNSTGPGTWKCYRCRKPFSVRVATAFQNSHVPLHVWLQALYLVAGTRGRLSAHMLAQLLTLSQRTAWQLKRKILAGMIEGAAGDAPARPVSPCDEVDLALRPHSGEANEPHLYASRYERFRQAVEEMDSAQTRGFFIAGLRGLIGCEAPAASGAGSHSAAVWRQLQGGRRRSAIPQVGDRAGDGHAATGSV